MRRNGCFKRVNREREIGKKNGESTSLANLGNIAGRRGDLAEINRICNLKDWQSSWLAGSLNNLGLIADLRGDLGSGTVVQRSLAREKQCMSLEDISQKNEAPEAERLYQKSLAINREIGHRLGEAIHNNLRK